MSKLPEIKYNPMKLNELARLLECPYEGDGNTEIHGFNNLENAQKGEIAFLSHSKYSHLLEKTSASVVIIPEDQDYDKIPVIKSKNPHLSFIKSVEFFYKPRLPQSGIHPTAQISSSARIGKDVSIGAMSYIGEDVEIGAKTILFPLVAVYPRVKIGKSATIHSCVSIREGVCIGNNVVIHNGAVIGADGFGYLQKEDGSHVKIPQTGTVIIEDDVEIGANTAVDKATLGETIIHRGTKIDNLVQVAHNVEIGAHSILAGQAGVSGSSKLGKKVIMAGQVGIADHINIGDNVIMAARTGVMKDIPANSVVVGTPHRNFKEFLRITAALPRLPELLKTVKTLKQKLEELEKKIQKKT